MATVASLKNSAYWQKRFEQLEDAENKISSQTLKEVEGYYNEAIKQIELDIEKWYRRFAKNNNISMADARQWLTGKDLTEFKWDVKDYIKAGKENAVTQQWMKELENASAKFHIFKLESLKIKTQNSLEQLYAKYQTSVTGAVQSVYKSGYYHTAYELQKGLGVGWDISGLDQKQIEKIISKPWAVDGVNFSGRIWSNKEKLIQTLHNELTQNVMIGGDVDKAINNIAKMMNTSKSNAERLILTEGAYFHSVSQKDSYVATGVKQYQILATLDSRTSEICRSLDGKVYDIKDMRAGLTAPPFHVRCRSTTVPYFDDDFGVPGERAARDEETGKTYYIPNNIKYSEWEQTFVNGGDKSAFNVIEFDGVTHYKAPPKPKKEYLTKKKLLANIVNADVEIEELEKQLQQATGKAANDLQAQLTALEAQKSDWQMKLDAKIKAEQVKALKKQQLKLENQINGFTEKTYSGIWKDDVTTADWSAKQGSIAAKKQYFENKLATATDSNEIAKWQGLLNDLAEFDTQGKALNDLKAELKKVQSDLTTLNSGAKLSDTYSQARKDAAYWFTDKNGGVKAADDVYRTKAGEVWKNASKAERDAIYNYTSSYHKFNEPLRGIEYGTNKFLGVGNVDLEQIGVKYSGFKPGEVKKEIDAITSIINKSSYDFDIWVQRGSGRSGMDKFLDIDIEDLDLPEAALASKLLGKEVTEYAFLSTGVAKGKGLNVGKGNIVFNIYAPRGTKMMYLEPISAYGKGAGRKWDGISAQDSFGNEAEMLFQRGTTFKIRKVEKSNGIIYIDMDVIEQEVN